MFENINEASCESAFMVASSMYNMYHKMLLMESEGFTVPMNTSLFMESDTPKRESTLEKIIWFIPDLIMKFVNFVRSKLKKIFGKENTVESAVSNISKEIKENSSGVVKKLAVAGIIATATTAGIIIYNKNKDKILSMEVDDSYICRIAVEYDIHHMVESLNKSMEVEKIVLHTYTPNDSKYKSYTKTIEAATADLKDAIKKKGSELSKYTIQQLMKELRELSNTIDKLSDVQKFGVRRTATSTGSGASVEKYNNAVKQWSETFSKFMTDTSDFISEVTGLVVCILKYHISDNENSENPPRYNFDFVKSFILYNSFRSSPVGFVNEAISSPSSRTETIVEPTESEFKQTGRTGEVIDFIQTRGSDFGGENNPVWGRIGNDWFVSMRYLKSIPRKFENDDIPTGVRETYEIYSFIINSEKEFSKMAQFMRNTSKPLLIKLTEGMFLPLIYGNEINDNPGRFSINIDILSKLVHYTQDSSSNLPNNLIPQENTIFCQIANLGHVQEYLDKKFGKNAKIVEVKSQPGYYKIYLDNKK